MSNVTWIIEGFYGPGVGVGGPLKVNVLKGGRRFTLTQSFIVSKPLPGLPHGVTVPADYTTDFASVPRLFWRLLPPWGNYSPAAVVHDYLYENHESLGVTRKQADQSLQIIAGVCGSCWVTRAALYLGVRVGGWVAWNRYKKGTKA